MTSQGGAYSQFKRALARRNVMLAWTLATELPKVSLADALELLCARVIRAVVAPDVRIGSIGHCRTVTAGECRVDPSHDLHVLLRNRPPSIPRWGGSHVSEAVIGRDPLPPFHPSWSCVAT